MAEQQFKNGGMIGVHIPRLLRLVLDSLNAVPDSLPVLLRLATTNTWT